LATIIDSSRLARVLCVLVARASYEVICPAIGAVGVIRGKNKKISRFVGGPKTDACWSRLEDSPQVPDAAGTGFYHHHNLILVSSVALSSQEVNSIF
jgi:hypothetical protein